MDNNLNRTPEMLEKAKSASSATELLTLAQENGITLTAEQAETYYTKLHPEIGALSDEELDNVSGGGWFDDGIDDSPPEKCEFCGWPEFERIYEDSITGYRWYCKLCDEPYIT